MPTDLAMKIGADHLRRDAFLYVRQSSLRQVFENTESTKRQYALRDRAAAMGWPIERIHVIDSDLGLSGAQAAGRDGFQRLLLGSKAEAVARDATCDVMVVRLHDPIPDA